MMDNHKIHTSIETREYLETVPDKFEFVFTSKHASWLNTIESFFSKMTRSMLREIRVDSIKEFEDDDFYFSCKVKYIGFKLLPRVKFFERDYKKLCLLQIR